MSPTGETYVTMGAFKTGWGTMGRPKSYITEFGLKPYQSGNFYIPSARDHSVIGIIPNWTLYKVVSKDTTMEVAHWGNQALFFRRVFAPSGPLTVSVLSSVLEAVDMVDKNNKNKLSS